MSDTTVGKIVFSTWSESRIDSLEKEIERLTAGKEKALRHLGECEDELRQANARVEALEGVRDAALIPALEQIRDGRLLINEAEMLAAEALAATEQEVSDE